MIGSHADENAISNWNQLLCPMRGMMIQDIQVQLFFVVQGIYGATHGTQPPAEKKKVEHAFDGIDI